MPRQLTDYLTLPVKPTQTWWKETCREKLLEYDFEVITVVAAVEFADAPGRGFRDHLRRSWPVKLPLLWLDEIPPDMPEPVKRAFEAGPDRRHMFHAEKASTALEDFANGEFRYGWWGLIAETDWVAVLVSNWNGGLPPR